MVVRPLTSKQNVTQGRKRLNARDKAQLEADQQAAVRNDAFYDRAADADLIFTVPKMYRSVDRPMSVNLPKAVIFPD